MVWMEHLLYKNEEVHTSWEDYTSTVLTAMVKSSKEESNYTRLFSINFANGLVYKRNKFNYVFLLWFRWEKHWQRRTKIFKQISLEKISESHPN